MDSLPPQLLLPILGVFLLLGFLTAFAKAASVTISDTRLAALAEENTKAKRLYLLLENEPSHVMGALDCITGFFWSLLAVFGVLGFAKPLFQLLNASLLGTGLILAIAHGLLGMLFFLLLPKRLGAKYAESAALNLSGFTKLMTGIGKPCLWICTLLANLIARLFGVRPHDLEEEVTEEEIRMMVDMGLESGAIDDDEKEMIHNNFEMDDKPIEDIMTHRTEVCVLWMEDSLEEWKAFVDETNHTRYPVCDEDIDNVIGVINSRDLYRFLLDGGNRGNLRSILREPYFVPGSMKADELFSQMQQKNTHIAMVLDEYGGFQGLITQEDLLEEIVGELYSEYDEPEKDIDILPLDENTWKIKGSALIEDVEEALSITLPEGDFNTFAGLVLDALETLPEDGETAEAEIGKLQIKVTSILEHRIEEALVCLNLTEETEEE